MKKKIVIASVVFLILLVVLTFVSKTVYNMNMTRVTAVKVDRGYVPLTYETTGKIEFPDAEAVKTTGDWKVDEIFAADGDAVEEGDLLCSFDTKASDIEIDSLRLEIKKLWSEINALNELPEDVRREQLRGPIIVYSELKLAEAKLDYAIFRAPPEEGLTAPVSGVIYGFATEEGEVISENETLLTIVTGESMLLRFFIPAGDGEIFQPGANVQATIGIGFRVRDTNQEAFERIKMPGKVISGVLKGDRWECLAEINAFYGYPVADQDVPVTVTHVGEMNNFVVPKDCVYSVEGNEVVYSIQEREGLFGKENYLRTVRVNMLFDNGEYAVLEVGDTNLRETDFLATRPSDAIREGTVVWVENGS